MPQSSCCQKHGLHGTSENQRPNVVDKWKLVSKLDCKAPYLGEPTTMKPSMPTPNLRLLWQEAMGTPICPWTTLFLSHIEGPHSGCPSGVRIKKMGRHAQLHLVRLLQSMNFLQERRMCIVADFQHSRTLASCCSFVRTCPSVKMEMLGR